VGAPTDHVFIPFGTGICGQAAETLETFVIDDVTAQSNYLACSLDVKSEIVVPIMKGDEFIGELDIDSHLPARFGKDDQAVMEEICVILSALW
jgi:GAF domain-containing protein